MWIKNFAPLTIERFVKNTFADGKCKYGLSPNPYTTEREQEYKEKILIFLLLFVLLMN